MAELPLEELISAYFDGELSADERARAEQVLLDDPQARRLLDQFRRLRGHVRQLPRHTLPGDFCQQVLRSAERQMLAQAATPAGARSTRTDAASADDPATPTSSSGGAVHFAVSQTCEPGSGPDCQPIGSEHVVTPAESTRVGVVTATPAADGAAVDVVFDSDGATAFQELSEKVVQACPRTPRADRR